MEMLVIGDLRFELRFSHRRKTAEIIIDRDGSLVIVAPDNVELAHISALVEQKRQLVYEKLAQKELLTSEQPKRQFVSGEGFYYLGRSYRLMLVEHNQQPSLRFDHGQFILHPKASSQGREHLIRWYTHHAQQWLKRRLPLWERRMDAVISSIEVRDLGFHWGSFGKGGNIYFHWKTILLPPDMIDYVIVHELAHAHEPNHTVAFWKRVERAMPDYEQRKDWIAEHGAELCNV